MKLGKRKFPPPGRWAVKDNNQISCLALSWGATTSILPLHLPLPLMKQVREDQVGAWDHLAIGTCAAGRIPYSANRKQCLKHRFVSKLFSLSRVNISVQKYLDSQLLPLVLSLAKLPQTFKRKKYCLKVRFCSEWPCYSPAVVLLRPLSRGGLRKLPLHYPHLPASPLEYHENSFPPCVCLLQLRWLCQLLVESHFYRFWLSWMFCVFIGKLEFSRECFDTENCNPFLCPTHSLRQCLILGS